MHPKVYCFNGSILSRSYQNQISLLEGRCSKALCYQQHELQGAIYHMLRSIDHFRTSHYTVVEAAVA